MSIRIPQTNVKTIPLTTLEGISSTQALAEKATAPVVDNPNSSNPHALPNSMKASQYSTRFNHNSGENFSPVIGSLVERQYNATLSINPFAGAAATRGNIVATSNASIGAMPTPQLSSYFYNNSRTWYDTSQNNDDAGNTGVTGPPVGNYLSGGSTAQIGPAQIDKAAVAAGAPLLNTGYSYTNPGNENARELAVQVSNDPPTIDVNLDAPRLNLTSGQDMYTFSMNNATLAQNFNTSMYYNTFVQKALTSDGHRVIPGATISK